MTAVARDGLSVSIVTVVLNRAQELERNLRSVAEQDYPWREHIVIDGGSTDGSVALLRDRAAQLGAWCSEADDGIADAMNKGATLAGGDLLLFLHADDRFTDPHALGRAMAQVKDVDHIWAFDVLFGDGATQLRLRPRAFNGWAHLRNPLPHQGVLCPRRVFDALGGFDSRWRISMDYDLWLNAMAMGIPLARVADVFSHMGSSGISSRRDWAGLRARLAEERAVQESYLQGWSGRLLHWLFWPPYLTYRRVRAWLGGAA